MVTTQQRPDTGPGPKTKLTYEDYARTPDDETLGTYRRRAYRDGIADRAAPEG